VIDISGKKSVPRMATASGKIHLKRESIDAIRGGKVKKGDALETAKVAALQAVKRTHELIPHCHQINIEECDVRFDVEDEAIVVHCRVKAHYKTGVEMETLVGVSVALLTIWDMVKYLEKDENGQYPTKRIMDISVKEKVKSR
jgi:cyclic pyranopterin phosphate synthase